MKLSSSLLDSSVPRSVCVHTHSVISVLKTVSYSHSIEMNILKSLVDCCCLCLCLCLFLFVYLFLCWFCFDFCLFLSLVLFSFCGIYVVVWCVFCFVVSLFVCVYVRESVCVCGVCVCVCGGGGGGVSLDCFAYYYYYYYYYYFILFYYYYILPFIWKASYPMVLQPRWRLSWLSSRYSVCSYVNRKNFAFLTKYDRFSPWPAITFHKLYGYLLSLGI